MKRSESIILNLVIVVCALTLAKPALAGVAWRTDVRAAQRQARSSHRLIMIDFYTDWCGWCQKLDRDVYPDPNVGAAVSQFIPIKLNAEREGRAIAAQFNISGYPTILFIDSSGREVDRIIGYREPADFIREANAAAAGRGQSPQSGTSPGIKFAAPDYFNSKTIPLGLMSAKVVDPYSRLTETQGAKLIRSLLDNHKDAKAATVAISMTKNGYGEYLGGLYNELGDRAAADRKADAAWGWYCRTVQACKDTACLSHAYLQIAHYYESIGDDNQERTNLQTLIALPDVSDDVKAEAQSMLDKVAPQR